MRRRIFPLIIGVSGYVCVLGFAPLATVSGAVAAPGPAGTEEAAGTASAVTASAVTGSAVTGSAPTAVAPTPNTDHSGRGRQYNAEIGLSLVPPQGWTKIAPPTADVSLAYVGPAVGRFRPNVNVVVADEDPDWDLAKAPDLLKQQYTSLFPDWKSLHRGPTTVQGRPAIYMISTVTMQGTPLKQFQLIVRGSGSRCYIVTCTAGASRFAKWETTFGECALSVRVD